MEVTCVSDPVVDGVVVATVVGQLDATGAARFWEVVPPFLGGSTSVLVDMTGADSLTSAGVGVLMRVLSRVRPGGGRLAIFGCGPSIRKVFEICRLEDALNIVDSLDEARRRLSV